MKHIVFRNGDMISVLNTVSFARSLNTWASIPIIALTATATAKVQLDIQKNLNMMDATVFKASFNRPNLYYEVRPKVDVMKEIIKFVKHHSGKSGIIYCLSRKKVEEVASNIECEWN